MNARRLYRNSIVMTSPQALVLASHSDSRRALLDKLQLAYTSLAPGIDETSLPEEAPESLVRRLSEAKARKIAERMPEAIVIGSDQVACYEGRALGKPGNPESALQQLRTFSGKQVNFLSGLCVMNPSRGTCHLAVETCLVEFRALSDDQIRAYLQIDRPFQCAGAFKSEGLGISLVRSIRCDDPNVLVGLPLIRLIDFLAREGVTVLG